MKKCNTCGEQKPLNEFWKNSRNRDGHQHNCKVCSRRLAAEHRAANLDQYNARKRRYYNELRLAVIAYLGGCCLRCSTTDHRVLEVDHIDGGGNQERKSLMRERWMKLLLSGDRTDGQLLCANCHRIKTYYPDEF